MDTVRIDHDRLPLRAAMEAGDLTGVVATFAPDAVLHSPLTNALTFEGRQQIGIITGVILEIFEGFHYTDETRVDELAFLAWEARVSGQAIEGVDRIRFNDQGLIEDFTVFFRPLPATAAALRAIGAQLARRKSRRRGLLVSVLTAPLAFMTRAGDRLGVRLIKSSL